MNELPYEESIVSLYRATEVLPQSLGLVRPLSYGGTGDTIVEIENSYR